MDAKLLLGALAFLCLGGYAVSENPGTDFALAFMQNVLPSSGKPQLELLLTSFFPDTKADITLPRRYFRTVVSLTAGVPTLVKLPKKMELLSSVRSNMTVRITSNKPISVVAINRRPNSTGVAVISPISDWGNEYYLITPDSELEGALGQVAIVNGPKPNIISVLLTGLVQLENTTYLPGEQLNLALGPWESIQLQTNQSFTASHLVSQEDVTVFAGLTCVGVHELCNHVYIQLPATNAWGFNFLVPPLPFRFCKLTILSASDTSVNLIHENNTVDVMVAPGKGQEFEVDSTTPLLINSLKPVMVLLYFGENNQSVASWIFYNLQPVEKACVAYAIVSLPGFNNSVLLVVQEDYWNRLEVNHKPLHGLQWGNINTTELAYTNLPLDNGYHFITNGGHDFGLATIGIEGPGSYGIPGICLDKEYLLCGFECKNAVCNVLETLSNCVSLAPPTCMTWGERHLLTFYGSHMLRPQSCPLVLINSHGDEWSLLPFSVEQEYSSSLTVRIRAFGQLLEISTKHPGVVFLNDEKLYTPINILDGGLNVTRIGFLATFVNVSFGLRVIIGDHGFLHLQIARRYYESLTGDCVAQSPKEMLNSTGLRSLDLLIACEPMTVVVQKSCDNVSATADFSSCQILSESEIFQSCHSTLDPKPFIDSCKSQVCDGGASCSAIEAYVLACGINGVDLMGWRNISLCGLQCPRHSHYESCSTNCQASCSESQVFNCDTSLCYEACICDEGYELSAESCVPKDECGCYWQGSYYPEGEEFIGKDCKRCRCSGSNMECHQTEGCPGGNICELNHGLWSCQPTRFVSCTLYSDSHYIAFDGDSYNFHGSCDSKMVGVCYNTSGLEAFEVHMVQEFLLGSYIKAIKIAVYGKTITFSPYYNGKVNVDDALLHTPYVVGTSLQIYKSNLGADILQTDFGLMVSFDHKKRLLIKLPDSYLGSVCGLCSSMFNRELNRPSCRQYCQGVCIHSSNELYHIEEKAYCGIINDSREAFRDCHPMVNPNPYYEACVNDVYSGIHWCAVLYAYAAACQEAGAEVYPWISQMHCDYGKQCPPNSTYTSSQVCASSCNPTCNITLPITCALKCQEGCQCDQGYIISGDRCVLPEDCGCYMDGKYWTHGDTFYDDQCQKQCSCLAGEVTCESHICSSEEQCSIVMGVRGCYPPSLTCLMSGKSYYTFDGRSYTVDKGSLHVMAMVTNTDKVVDFEVFLERRVLSDLVRVQKAILKVYGYRIILSLYREDLEVNGNQTHFPVDLENRIFAYESNSNTVVETDFGLQLAYNSSMVSLTIPVAYAGKVGGLCGNANALASDDIFMPIEGLYEVSTSFPAFDAKKDCELIIQAGGPFRDCHGLLEPQGFYNNCISAMDSMHSICASIQNYDTACLWASATVHPWINQTLCKSDTPVADLSLSTLAPPSPVPDVICLPNVVPSACLSLDKTSCLFQTPRNFTWLDAEDFQSSTECSLTLVEVCSNDTQMDAFRVSLHYDHLGNYSTESLHVEVFGLNIVVPWNWQNGVWVNNMSISLPACLIPGKLQIRLEGSDLILDTLFGLVIKYDHNGLILIQLPFGYQSYICGQCAKREPREIRIKFTSEISKNESENPCHLRMDKETWTRYEDDSTIPNYCSMILGDESPFRDCHNILKPDRFYDSCMFHLCQELQSGRNGDSAACRDLDEYATLCQLHHGVIKPWRNESFCPFQCPPQGTYELCTRTCIQCQNGNCSGPCLEGCNCIEGYLWNGVNCVISDMCIESIYQAKPQYLNCDTNSPFQSKCRVCKLNFHQISTFGSFSSTLEGNGVYDLVRKCDSSAPQWLRVALSLRPPQTAKLYIFYEQSFITINSTLDVWVNGQLEVLPISLSPELYVSKATNVVVLGQPGTIAIFFSSEGDLEINVEESLSTELCGACAFGYLFPNQSPMFSLEPWRAEDLC